MFDGEPKSKVKLQQQRHYKLWDKIGEQTEKLRTSMGTESSTVATQHDSSKLETVAIATKEDDIYEEMDRMSGGFGRKMQSFTDHTNQRGHGKH